LGFFIVVKRNNCPGNRVSPNCIYPISQLAKMDLQQLIKECKQGSAAAQKCLFDHFAESMMMVCCRYVKNEQDAEEVLLNGFHKFFLNIGMFQYRNDPSLFVWIKKIMINESLMFLRKRNAFLLTVETSHDNIAWNDDMLGRLNAEDIFKMITRLPTGYRTVFNLYAVEGMNHQEIAELLKITEGTSKSQLFKARQLLQKMLIQLNEEYGKRKIN
jgi:RNA polymerase sigma-70 factor (ECF subfamily)